MAQRPPTNRLAEGSALTGQRIHASAVRAIDAYQTITRQAEALLEELDDVTPVCGVPVELDDEDSMVVVVREALESNKR